MAQVEHPSHLQQSPMRKKCLGIAPAGIAWATPPQKCAKTEPGTKTGHVDGDAPLASVRKKTIRANVNGDLPTIRSLNLRLLPDQYVAEACFFYSVAQSLYALPSDIPQSATDLQEKASAVYREVCDSSDKESPTLVHNDLDKETWGARPQGGLPD